MNSHITHVISELRVLKRMFDADQVQTLQPTTPFLNVVISLETLADLIEQKIPDEEATLASLRHRNVVSIWERVVGGIGVLGGIAAAPLTGGASLAITVASVGVAGKGVFDSVPKETIQATRSRITALRDLVDDLREIRDMEQVTRDQVDAWLLKANKLAI